MYGEGGRLGIIEPGSAVTLAAEVPPALPADMLAVFSRLCIPGGEISVRSLDAMLAGATLETATAQLVEAEVDVVSFACTSGSFIHGPEWDRALIERMRSAGAKVATTTSSAVIECLRHLGVRRLAIGTPYAEEINEAERRYFAAAGFDVVHLEGLGLERDEEFARLELDDVRALARSVAVVGADATFLSCTALPGLAILPELAAASGRRVVTSNSATLWQALRLARTSKQRTSKQRTSEQRKAVPLP